MKIAVLGDVGQPVYHVGDEAMTHAAIDELRARGFDDIVVLTRSVPESEAAFDAVAVPTLAFPWPPRERADYLRRVLAIAQDDPNALPQTDPAWEFLAHLRQCDALLVAGGGNMNSLYGWLLYERVAAVRLAKMLGLKVVVSGQTLGPDLYGPDRDAARSLLEAADLIGAREASSLQLMRELAPEGTSIRPCLDDASFMSVTGQQTPIASRTTSAAWEDTLPAGPYIAATFSPGHGEVERDAYLSALATALDEASSFTGLPVVFLPHMATPGIRSATEAGEAAGSRHAGTGQSITRESDVDEQMHQDIAARMVSSNVVLIPIQDAYRTIELTRRSALVITSRYHPAVFALDAGVPVVALAPEAYSEARMRGALQNWGLGTLTLTLPSLLDGTLTRAVSDVWTKRDALSSFLVEARASHLLTHHQWWDGVASALRGDALVSGSTPMGVLAPPALDPGWQTQAAAAALAFLPTASASTRWRIENEHLRGELESLVAERDAARNELASWFESRSFKLARKVAAVASIGRRSK